jgi:hypothetical protein
MLSSFPAGAELGVAGALAGLGIEGIACEDAGGRFRNKAITRAEIALNKFPMNFASLRIDDLRDVKRFAVKDQLSHD